VATAVFVGVLLFLMVAGRSRFFRDPGTFWHVRFGQQMLQTGELIRHDSCSFTMPGKPWVPTQWAAECAMALIHRLAGWDGLLLATAVILAAVYAWIAGRSDRAGLHPLGIVALTVLVLAASAHQFHVRPLVVSIALLGPTFALLVDVEARVVPLRRLWWLVPLFALWANLHGGVLGGLGTVGLVVGGWTLARMLGRSSPLESRRQVAAAAGLVAACTIATLVNPYGLELPRTWLRVLSLPLADLVQEHAPLWRAGGVELTATLVLAGVYVVVLAGVLPRQPRAVWLLPLVWFGLAMMRNRHAPLFAVTAAVALVDMLPQTRWAAWLARDDWLRLPGKDANRTARRRGWRGALIPATVVALALLLQTAAVSVPVLGRGWTRLDPSRWPTALRDELAQIDQASATRPAPIRIFNDDCFGGFLIYYTPHLKIFVDDRFELYGRQFLEAFVDAKQNDPARLEPWAREYGIEYALVPSGSRLDGYLRAAEAWTPIGPRTPAATLYRRQDTAPQ